MTKLLTKSLTLARGVHVHTNMYVPAPANRNHHLLNHSKIIISSQGDEHPHLYS